jgi:hypothetical protein
MGWCSGTALWHVYRKSLVHTFALSIPSLGYDCFLQNPFQFINYHNIQWLYSLSN